MFSIYALKEPDTGEIRYFGKTFQKPKDRLSSHLSAKPFWKVSKWIQSLKQSGKRPVLEVLMTGLTNEEANEEEIFLIAWGRTNGLNLTNSASGGSGPVNHFTGRKLTEAEKQHLREINTGKKQSPETVAKRILKGEKHWTFGKPRAEETRKKISASLSGANHPYWGQKRPGMGGLKGVPRSEAVKRKISETKRRKRLEFLAKKQEQLT